MVRVALEFMNSVHDVNIPTSAWIFLVPYKMYSSYFLELKMVSRVLNLFYSIKLRTIKNIQLPYFS